MSETLSIELEDEVRRALDRLVQKTARSVDDIVNQAVRDYLDVHEWQQRKIEAGIAAAERGEFATEDEIARIAAKYSKRGRGSSGRHRPPAISKASEIISLVRVRARHDESSNASGPGPGLWLRIPISAAREGSPARGSLLSLRRRS